MGSAAYSKIDLDHRIGDRGFGEKVPLPVGGGQESEMEWSLGLDELSKSLDAPQVRAAGGLRMHLRVASKGLSHGGNDVE